MKHLFWIRVQFDNYTTPTENFHAYVQQCANTSNHPSQRRKSCINYSSLQMKLVPICDVWNMTNAHKFQSHSRHVSVSYWSNVFKDPMLHDFCIRSKETGSAIYHLFFSSVGSSYTKSNMSNGAAQCSI